MLIDRVRGIALAVSFAVSGMGMAQDAGNTSRPDVVRVGHWLVARGRIDDGVFVASRAELLERGKYDLLIGTVPESQADPDRFRLLGQPVHVSERTEWKGDLARRSLAGKRVSVEGRWRGPGKLSAREIESRGPGRERIGGRVDSVRRVDGGFEAMVMRFVIFLPEELEVEHDVPIAQLTLAPPREITALEGPADDDEDDLFGEGVLLSDHLVLESQVEWRSVFEDDFDLDADDAEDRVDNIASLRSRLVWVPNASVSATAELRYRFRWRDDEDDGRSSDGDADLGEAFVSWHDAFGTRGLDVTLGRQDFDESREWLYDQNLDALRLAWTGADAALEVSASGTLADGDLRDRESHNLIAYLSNASEKRHAAVWSSLRDIGIEGAREKNLHIGARALGDWVPDAKVWIDVAHLSGERAGADVDAWGYDAGVTWTPDSMSPVSFTAGYAYGAGDDDLSDGDDGTFRQTGLQDNNARFGGVTSFRYYGELFDPELSNLGILTLGVGVRFAQRSSLDLVFHRYVQDRAAPSLAESDLDASPTGVSPSLGKELDLILGVRESKRWDLEVIAAYFDPGAAFSNDDDALLAKIQLRLRF